MSIPPFPRSRKAAFYSDPDRRPSVLPPDLDTVPGDLRAADRWVLWRLVWRPNRKGGGKWDKVPFRPDGTPAKSNDPATWVTFDVAAAAYRAGGFDGIGFALGAGFAGIDIDDVRDPDTGVLIPAAEALVGRFGTYGEAGPSGTGVKLIGRGEWQAGWHKKPFPGGGEIEAYSSGRYFTVTGRAVGTHPVTGIQAALDELAARFSDSGRDTGAGTTRPAAGDDDELIRRATEAANGAKFRRLWDGDTSEYGGDESRADLALCGMLAFWTGGDAARVDALFRRSGLMRAKWDERRGETTYGRRTVAAALDGKTEFYTAGGGTECRAGGQTAAGPVGGGTANLPQPRVTVPDYRPFPVEVLPPVLREFVAETAAAVDCDPAFVALPALTIAGAAVGAAVVVSPKRRFREPPALWCCPIADSGTGKTPGLAPSSDLAFAIDTRLKAEHAAAMTFYSSDLDAWNGSADRDPDRKPVKPSRVYFAVIDTTIERLAEMLGGSRRGLVVIRDELSGWFGGFTRYKGKAGGSDVSNWLSLFDAGPVRVHRRTGEPRDIEADGGFVAVCGGIQPDILRDHLSDPAYIASGLAARLVFAMPPKHCPRWTDAELSEDTEKRFAAVLGKLRAIPFDSKKGPNVVRLDAAALARFRALNDEFAAQAENLDGGPMAAALPKAVRYALRLALIGHLVTRAAADRDPDKEDIGEDSMRAGEVLARWFVHEAERVYAVIAERPADRSARLLVEWVVRKGGRVRARDLIASNRRKYPTAAAAELALDALASAGLGEWATDPPGPKGGAPGRAFLLHPAPRPSAQQNPAEPTAAAADGIRPPPSTSADSEGGTPENPEKPAVVLGSAGRWVGSPDGEANRSPGGAEPAVVLGEAYERLERDGIAEHGGG
jgi:Protein of unknown function (DUF3987)